MSSNKPTPSAALGNIPDELREIVQWVVCNNVKVPKHARIGTNASTTNPGTWSSYGKAREAVESGKYKLIGFVFTEKDPYIGIDLDHVIDLKTGKIEPWAQAIIDQMDSYTEVSQSGTGIHVIIRGEKPGQDCKRKDGQVEIYDHARYFALTGNILGNRNSIEDRQEQLDSLYAETFGEASEVVVKPVGDLVLDRGAEPPLLKLEDLLRRRGFSKTWQHERTDLASLSEYDLSLANYAARHGCSDQEIANLIIAFRRRHGDDKDLKKALRLDYISGVLDKVRYSGVLDLLPFKVKRLLQIGTEEAEYVLELENGETINMGETSSFLSPGRAYQRLYDAGYAISVMAMNKHWSEIVVALRLLVKVEPTMTKLEEVEQWIMACLARGSSGQWGGNTRLQLVDAEHGLGSAMSSGSQMYSLVGFAGDIERRLYMHIGSLIHHARMVLGQNLTQKTLAGYLRMMGFEKIRNVSVYHGQERSQISVWVSPPGFLPKELVAIKAREMPALDWEKGHSIESEDEADQSLTGQDEGKIEKFARELREKKGHSTKGVG